MVIFGSQEKLRPRFTTVLRRWILSQGVVLAVFKIAAGEEYGFTRITQKLNPYDGFEFGLIDLFDPAIKKE